MTLICDAIKELDKKDSILMFVVVQYARKKVSHADK